MIGSGRTEAEDYSVEEGQWISVMNCLFQNTLFCGSRWISKDANFMVHTTSAFVESYSQADSAITGRSR